MTGAKKLVIGASGFLGKAEQELGWQPRPIHDSIRRAAQFYRENRRGGKNR
jgi:hypothetical protein